MSFERVTLLAGDSEYEGWERVSIKGGIDMAAPEFTINTTEQISLLTSPFDQWAFPPDTLIAVQASGDLLITGYVQDYLPAAAGESHVVTIHGYGTSRLLVDSSPYHETGTFEDKSVLSILSALAAPFGVQIGVFNAQQAASSIVEIFQLRRGETVWSEATRLLGDFGATLMGRIDGSAAIARAGNTRHEGGISQLAMPGAVPIKDMSARFSSLGRYSDTTVTYQRSVGVEDTDTMGEARARDTGVNFFKHREIIAQTEMNAMRARALAAWNATRAAGFAVQANISVPGWRDSAGKLWGWGNLVFISSPFLKLEADMCIQSVTFNQSSEGGTTTDLTLVDPRAFGGQASGLSGSGPIWNWGIGDILNIFK